MLEDATRREQRDLELLRRVHDHDDAHARDELARRFMPLVYSIARKYQSNGEPFEDIAQAGAIGLVKAIDRFDIRAGSRFVSFAAPNIQGEIRRHFRDHTWAVHVPRSMQELSQRVRQAQRELLDRTGREPSVAQLAKHLGEPAERVTEALSAGDAYEALSIDQPARDGEAAPDRTGRIDRGYDGVEQRVTIADACSTLDERTRHVVFQRFYEDRLQREIADEIGVSQMQVSRLLSRGLEQMREHLSDAEAAEALPQAA
ncbi:MAG: SigB/SigF/SigG family RNA polymerase sigma factor [Patulibacter sp.]|nr:SigB/SigF/SigG family RNA polymerase sigma factor [Patulibacter sp.]